MDELKTTNKCPACDGDSVMPPVGSPDFPRCIKCGKEWYWTPHDLVLENENVPKPN